MKTYLLNVKVYDYIDDIEDEYVENFSSLDKAKNYGLEFLNKNLSFFCQDKNKSIQQALKEVIA